MWRLVYGHSTETRTSRTSLDSRTTCNERRTHELPEKPFCSMTCPSRLSGTDCNEGSNWKEKTQQMKQKIQMLENQTGNMEAEIRDHVQLRNEYNNRIKNIENNFNDSKCSCEDTANSHRYMPRIPYGDKLYSQQQYGLADQKASSNVFNPSQQQFPCQKMDLQCLYSPKEMNIKEMKDKLAKLERSKLELLNKIRMLESKITQNSAIERENNELLKEVQNKQDEKMDLVQKLLSLQTKNHRLIGEIKDLHVDLETIRLENKFRLEKVVGSLEDELKKERELSNEFHTKVVTLEKIIDEMEISAEKEVQQMQTQLNNTIGNMYTLKQMNKELVEDFKNLQKYVDELQDVNRTLQSQQDMTVVEMSKIISDMQHELQELKEKLFTQTLPQITQQALVDNEKTRNKISQTLTVEPEPSEGDKQLTPEEPLTVEPEPSEADEQLTSEEPLTVEMEPSEDDKQMTPEEPLTVEPETSEGDKQPTFEEPLTVEMEPSEDDKQMTPEETLTVEPETSEGDEQLTSEEPLTVEMEPSEDDKQMTPEEPLTVEPETSEGDKQPTFEEPLTVEMEPSEDDKQMTPEEPLTIEPETYEGDKQLTPEEPLTVEPEPSEGGRQLAPEEPLTDEPEPSEGDRQLAPEFTDDVQLEPSTDEPQPSEDTNEELGADPNYDSKNQNTSAIELQNENDNNNQLDSRISYDKEELNNSKTGLQENEKYEEAKEMVELDENQDVKSQNEKFDLEDDQSTEIDKKESKKTDSDDYLDSESEPDNLKKAQTSQDDNNKDIETLVTESTAAQPIETYPTVVITKESHESIDSFLENERRPKMITFSDVIEAVAEDAITEDLKKKEEQKAEDITKDLKKKEQKAEDDITKDLKKKEEQKAEDGITKDLKEKEDQEPCICKKDCKPDSDIPETSSSTGNDKLAPPKEQNGKNVKKLCTCTFNCPLLTNGDTFISEEAFRPQIDNEPSSLQAKLQTGKDIIKDNVVSAIPQQNINLTDNISEADNIKKSQLRPVVNSSQENMKMPNTKTTEESCVCINKTVNPDKYNVSSKKTILENYCKCPNINISTQNAIKLNSDVSKKPISEIRKRSLHTGSSEVLEQISSNERQENYFIPQDERSKTINILFLKSGNGNMPSCKCLTLLDVMPTARGNDLESVNTEGTMATSSKQPNGFKSDQQQNNNKYSNSYQYINERKCNCPLHGSSRPQPHSNTASTGDKKSEDCQCLMSAILDTVLRLTDSLTVMQSKCRTKDIMIQSLADELNIRSGSGVFENLLTNLCMDESEFPRQPQDFDRIALCEYLKKPPGYVGELSYPKRPCIPPCPTKDKYPEISKYPKNQMQLPCRGPCSKKNGEDKFSQKPVLNVSCDDPCKASCSKRKHNQDLKNKTLCESECKATCSKPKSVKNGYSSMQLCNLTCEAPCKTISQKGFKQLQKNTNGFNNLLQECTAPCSNLSARDIISKIKEKPIGTSSSFPYPRGFKQGSINSGCSAPCASDRNQISRIKTTPSFVVCQAQCSKSTRGIKQERSRKSSIPPCKDSCYGPCKNDSKKTNFIKTNSTCVSDCMSSCAERGSKGNVNPFSDFIPSNEVPTSDVSQSEDENVKNQPSTSHVSSSKKEKVDDDDEASTAEASNAAEKMTSNGDEPSSAKASNSIKESDSSLASCHAPCAQTGLTPDTKIPPPSDLEVIHLTSIEAVLVSWKPPPIDDLRGYEVHMDGSMIKKVSRHRTTALLRRIECSCDINIKVYTITRISRSFNAATYP
ncbi:hypothetical protein L9F63_010066 [Diploptera punctata]|uniref:Fibronectin type-III domain-containing protein n=1 Tax=Diploptera punctata TaxID=6984 RepID=A0AAD8AI37_DIPPU|nr:hypothetical protein L9F63_010066 [Diploptera punctata]